MTQVRQTGTMVAQPSPLGGADATGYVRAGPWTEQDYFGLGDTPDRVELLDGSLLVSPAPTPEHQAASRTLAQILDPSARAAGLEVYEAIGVRLATGRVFIPDLVVTRPLHDRTVAAVDADVVVLVAEITSRSTRTVDRVLKYVAYAGAGIETYLLLDRGRDPWLSITVYQLGERGRYETDDVAEPGTRPAEFALGADLVALHPELFQR